MFWINKSIHNLGRLKRRSLILLAYIPAAIWAMKTSRPSPASWFAPFWDRSSPCRKTWSAA